MIKSIKGCDEGCDEGFDQGCGFDLNPLISKLNSDRISKGFDKGCGEGCNEGFDQGCGFDSNPLIWYFF